MRREIVGCDYRASLRIPDGHFHKTGFSPFSSATSAYDASRILDPGKGPHLAEEGELDKALPKVWELTRAGMDMTFMVHKKLLGNRGMRARRPLNLLVECHV